MALGSAAGVDRGTIGAGVGAGVVGDTSCGCAGGTGALGGRAAGLGCVHARASKATRNIMQQDMHAVSAACRMQTHAIGILPGIAE